MFHVVDAAGRHAGEIGRIEAGRRAAEVAERKAGQQISQVGHRHHRLRGAQPGEQRCDRYRLDTLFCPSIDPFGTQPLRQRRILAGEQRHVGETRRRSAQCGKHLQLYGAVGDMVFPARNVGDAQIDIVHHRRQHVEPRAIGAAHHRIGQRGGGEMAMAAHAVLPVDIGGFIHSEPPMGFAAFGFQLGLVGIAQRQCGAVVNGRQPARQGNAALQLQLLSGFIAGIGPALCREAGQCVFIAVEAVRLLDLHVRRQAQPGEIVPDGLGRFRGGARQVGIIQPQHKAATRRTGEQPVDQRSADIAGVEPASGRGSEAGDDHGGGIAG